MKNTSLGSHPVDYGHMPCPIPLGSVTYVSDEMRAWYQSRADQPDRMDLAIVNRATNECVGEVVLNEVDTDNLSCNFRTLMGPRGRDRGLGT